MIKRGNAAENWIRDSKTGKPKPPVKQPGYYSGYSTLGQKAYWDAATREEVEHRVLHVPEIRFFTAEELPIISAVCERIIPQDDRLPEYRIPIVSAIDERLFENKIDGYRFSDMPSDRDAYRLAIEAIEKTAHAVHQKSFVELDVVAQEYVVRSIHDGEKLAAEDIWARLPIHRFWHVLVQDCVTAYYAHPFAWDEIGYGGPAYPRAYMRLEGGLPEPWEVDEQRYEWDAPINTISDVYETGPGMEESQAGQGGTH